jgi:hypothetical protein
VFLRAFSLRPVRILEWSRAKFRKILTRILVFYAHAHISSRATRARTRILVTPSILNISDFSYLQYCEEMCAKSCKFLCIPWYYSWIQQGLGVVFFVGLFILPWLVL